LVRPNGKQLSLDRQEFWALKLAAIELADAGIGGGIVRLLQPTDIKQKRRLNKYQAQGIKAKLVKIRHKGERLEKRQALKDRGLYVLLVRTWITQTNPKGKYASAPKRYFSEWLARELIDKNSEAYKLAKLFCPLLVYDPPKASWIKKQLVKNTKK